MFSFCSRIQYMAFLQCYSSEFLVQLSSSQSKTYGFGVESLSRCGRTALASRPRPRHSERQRRGGIRTRVQLKWTEQCESTLSVWSKDSEHLKAAIVCSFCQTLLYKLTVLSSFAALTWIRDRGKLLMSHNMNKRTRKIWELTIAILLRQWNSI